MKCAKNAIDTHPKVINEACGMWYYPNDTGSSKPCKFYTRCQGTIKKALENIEWCKKYHEEYLKENQADG